MGDFSDVEDVDNSHRSFLCEREEGGGGGRGGLFEGTMQGVGCVRKFDRSCLRAERRGSPP